MFMQHAGAQYESLSGTVIIVTTLQSGQSRLQILVGARDFSLLQNIWTGTEAELYGYGYPFLGIKQPGHEVNHSFHPVPRLRMSGATSLLPIYTFVVLTGKALPLPRVE
jgi:hypothetical protein